MNPRLRDGLLGAAVTVVLLVVAAGLFLWVISAPADNDATDGDTTNGDPSDGDPSAGDGTAPSPPSDPVPSPTGAGEPPSDLDPAEMWLDDIELDASAVVLPNSTLRDVTVVARDLRTGPDGFVAAGMVVDATVPFDVVAAQIGEDTRVRSGGPSQVVVERTVEVAGRRVDVVATGSVDVVAGRIVVEPTTIDIGGPSFLAGVIGTAVRQLVTIEYEVEGLPEGLVLQDVAVQDDGFRANLRGEDVRLAFPASP